MSEPHAPWRPVLDAALKATDGHPGARYVQLATVRPDGRPANRTVVFRGFLGSSDNLYFVTDARSVKNDQLGTTPWAELCWYFHQTREQFRLLCLAAVNRPEDDGHRAELWRRLPDHLRRQFTWPQPHAARSPDHEFRHPIPAEPPASFGLLVAVPDRVEYLDLRLDPHDRTVFQFDGSAWSVDEVNP